MTRVEPSELDDVIWVIPAMRPTVRSSGVATVAAITSGLAPAILAWMAMVGKSTCGKGATGNKRKAMLPASNTASASKVVATGRRMKGADKFMRGLLHRHDPLRPGAGPATRSSAAPADRRRDK